MQYFVCNVLPARWCSQAPLTKALNLQQFEMHAMHLAVTELQHTHNTTTETLEDRVRLVVASEVGKVEVRLQQFMASELERQFQTLRQQPFSGAGGTATSAIPGGVGVNVPAHVPTTIGAATTASTPIGAQPTPDRPAARGNATLGLMQAAENNKSNSKLADFTATQLVLKYYQGGRCALPPFVTGSMDLSTARDCIAFFKGMMSDADDNKLKQGVTNVESKQVVSKLNRLINEKYNDVMKKADVPESKFYKWTPDHKHMPASFVRVRKQTFKSLENKAKEKGTPLKASMKMDVDTFPSFRADNYKSIFGMDDDVLPSDGASGGHKRKTPDP